MDTTVKSRVSPDAHIAHNYIVLAGFNDLASVFPDVAACFGLKKFSTSS
jgi:hypothetical protein